MSFTIAIIGRPNVGKSTLFNRLVGQKLALVDDEPGVTRDRREGGARLGDLEFTVIDTAGLDDAAKGSLTARMQEQTEAAIGLADALMFVVDARAGLTPSDRAFAELARRADKPVLLVANKSEGRQGETGAMEAYALGLGDPIRISAEHGEGMSDLYDELRALMLEAAEPGEVPHRDGTTEADQEPADRPIRVAVVGRPNAGKSTLINRLLGEERLLTGAEAGITRDSISVEVGWDGRKFRVFDTAGLRRRSRIEEKLEKLSVADALRAVRFAEVVVLIIDARNRFEEQDLRIADLIEREGRALVIAVNKWDLMAERPSAISALRAEADHWLPQVKGVPVVAVSGLTGEGVDRLMKAVEAAFAVWNKRIPTALLNRWFEQAVDANPPPAVSGRRLKLNYITQAKARPPSFVLFCSRAEAVPQSYLRYLVNSLREHFGLPGTPVRISAAREGEPLCPQAQAAVMSDQVRLGTAEVSQTAPPGRSAAVAFVFVTVLLDMLALGLIFPILPKLVESSSKRHRACGSHLRPVRYGLGADAIRLLADPRQSIGPVWPQAGGAAVEFRAWAGLRADGDGAVPDLAFGRQDHLRDHVGECLDGLRLYSGHDAAGTPGRGVRKGRRRLRRRFHPGSRAGRLAWRARSAAAVLGGGGLEPYQFALRPVDPAGIAAA